MPNWMIRHVNSSITTRTHGVLTVAVSQWNKSQIRTAILCPAENVRREALPNLCLAVMNLQDSANDIVANLNNQSQRDLLGYAGTPSCDCAVSLPRPRRSGLSLIRTLR